MIWGFTLTAGEHDEYLHGGCASWALAHQREFPHLRLGVQWEHVGKGHPEWEATMEDNHLDPDDEMWEDETFRWPQHVFTHDDTHAYDVRGAHPLPGYGEWDENTLNHTPEDAKAIAEGAGIRGQEPPADLVRRVTPHTAARLAMAWSEWAPHVQHEIVPGAQHPMWGGRVEQGRYYISHEDGSEIPEGMAPMESDLTYWRLPRNRLEIDTIATHPGMEGQGIAEALGRRMVQDNPGHEIIPGNMTDDGRAFHDRMLEKNPAHRDLLARLAMPTWYHLTDDPDFKLDSDREPANYNGQRTFGKGVFLTQRPDEWAYTEDDGGWSGDRPYIAEIDAPENLHEKLNVWHDPHATRPSDLYPGSEEIFVPNLHFHRLRVKNVRPRWASTDHPEPRSARSMTAAVTVYTQPNCVQCTMTKKQLDKLGIAHDTVDVATNPKAHEYVTSLGYKQAPVVVVNDGEHHWAGFRPDRLKELAE